MQLNSPLTVSDVELRIGQTSAKGFSLLLYKTARTDVKRLDEVYGTKWKNRFFYDNNDLLCCEISIFDMDIKEWVSRVDVGTESQTEREKGSYSDAFKRAGFKWNIGSELYQSPFIWVNWEMKETAFNNKKKYNPISFFQSNLEIKEFTAKDGQVESLIIDYKGKGAVFSYSKQYQPQVEPVSQVKCINESQASLLKELIEKSSITAEQFNIKYKIKKIEEIQSHWFIDVKKRIETNIQAKNNKEK